MRIRTPGKINDYLWFLGTKESCIYLLENKGDFILINAGLSFLVPEILKQFKDFGIDESKITKMLILHSHFDHVGIAPFFKRRNPGIELLASSRTWGVLGKPKVIQSINAANHEVIEKRGLVDICSDYDLDWTTEISGRSVGENDRIDLGGMELFIFETPGHSPCSISAYVPDLQILFPSEAGGLPCGGKIITYGTSNYTDFENSLQKLKELKAEYICSDHYGCVTGEEAHSFIYNSIREAAKRRRLMQAVYNQRGSVDQAARELAEHYKDENFINLVSEDVFTESHRQMIMHVNGLKG